MTKALSNFQMDQLIRLRHDLHSQPELSGEELNTAQRIISELEQLGADEIVGGLGPWLEPDGNALGGTGVIAIFDSGKEGPSLLFRSELDGLPIEEISDLAYRSEVPTKAHLCGHDGHMSILMGLAMRLQEQRPERGKVILLFQPAEETGKGARALLADPAFQDHIPDMAFALHNLPGLALGEVGLKQGAMCCASRGIRICLEGKTSHASMPQDGISPVGALIAIAEGLAAMSNGLDEGQGLDDNYKLVTITHMTMGEPCFGVSPATGELWATLRTVSDGAMDELVKSAHALAKSEADRFKLYLELEEDDVFDACTNAQVTTEIVAKALKAEQIAIHELSDPMRWSEDFGRLGQHCHSTLFVLGSGEGHPQLHNPDFDFPDALIPIAVRVFERIIRDQLG
ncbi:amidohydrolase [uncultured Cohaesibacter sp.]|uniref:amidohydrolase n=1 Tax=uncultured Cohaesibacter sp. TaxID=1002546 RepID=UPI00293036F1|nr:amidohydrolase [uncultured Cohaesibacter sp.]